MTKSTKAKLAYMTKYESSPEEMKKRVDRNRARRHAIASGKASVGDGTQVDHIKPLGAGGSSSDSNTRVLPRSKNESWRARQPEMYGKKKK